MLGQRVSIVIPVYNAAPWLPEAIDSCLFQTHQNIEVIVVDDGSTDDSLEIARSYQDRIRVISEMHCSAAHARNVGFKNSRGEFVCFLDADDVLVANKIERQLKVLVEEQLDYVFGDFQKIDSKLVNKTNVIKTNPTVDLIHTLIEQDSPEDWLFVAGSLYRRSLIEHAGGWDESITVNDDHVFNFRIAVANPRFRYLPGVSVYYRKGHQKVTLSTMKDFNETSLEAYTSIHRAFVKIYEMLAVYPNAQTNHWHEMRKKFVRIADHWESNCEDLHHEALNILQDIDARLSSIET